MFLTSSFSKRYEKLPVTIFNEATDAAKIVVEDIIKRSQEKAKKGENLVLALASTSACLSVYDEMIMAVKAKKLSFKNIEVFDMDDYYPLDRNELQSHYRFIKECLIDEVDIPAKNVHYIKSNKMDDVQKYCKGFEDEIAKAGGIDVMITSNMGMNEPASAYNSETRMIALNYSSRVAAASDFFGVEDVPYYAITMGIATILKSKEIYFLAWGEGSGNAVKSLVEGDVDSMNPSSYLQEHKNIHVFIDNSASVKLTRIDTPWLTDKVEWTPYLIRKAVFWLCRKLNKPILKLTDRDYNDNLMSNLVTTKGPASQINIKVFNDLQHTISGWPGGKPNADDSTRPERAKPFPKRVLIFSPHPDDDVISMGGTFRRLITQGHDVHVAYETSGNIAVHDDVVLQIIDTARECGFDDKYDEVKALIASKRKGEPEPLRLRQLKGSIRRAEAKSAGRHMGINDQTNVHFLNLPFYETGGVKKGLLTSEDINRVVKLLQEIKPDQIYAAGDLSDPHGTHRTCIEAVLEAMHTIKDEAWVKDCRFWLYRGAWQEWDLDMVDMAVPLSPDEVIQKRHAIYRHLSQKD